MNISLTTSFREQQSEPWRSDVARQLNVVLGWAQYFDETNFRHDLDMSRMVEDARALVRRVAEFEEIK